MAKKSTASKNSAGKRRNPAKKVAAKAKPKAGNKNSKPAKARGGTPAPARSPRPQPAKRPSATAQAKRSPVKADKPARRSKDIGKLDLAQAAARLAGASEEPVEDLPATTYLRDKELQEFREMLIQKRRQLIGDVAHLEDEAIRKSGHGGGSLSSMPIHMADLGSDTWEQELTLGLIENERGLLREVDEALMRIDDRTYGLCVATGKPITRARLRAKPWAKYCIEYARKRELGLV